MVATNNRIGNRKFWIKSEDYDFSIEGSVWIPCLKDIQTTLRYWILLRAVGELQVEMLIIEVIELMKRKFLSTRILGI